MSEELKEPFVDYKDFNPDNVTLEFTHNRDKGMTFIKILYRYSNGLSGTLNIKLPTGYNVFASTEHFKGYRSLFSFLLPLAHEEVDASSSNVTRMKNIFTPPEDVEAEQEQEYKELVAFLTNMEKVADKVQETILENSNPKSPSPVTQKSPLSGYMNEARMNIELTRKKVESTDGVESLDALGQPIRPPVTFLEQRGNSELYAREAKLSDLGERDQFTSHPTSALVSIPSVSVMTGKANFKILLNRMIIKVYKGNVGGSSGNLNPASVCRIFDQELSEEEKAAIMNWSGEDEGEDGEQEQVQEETSVQNVDGGGAAVEGFTMASETQERSKRKRKQAAE